MRRGLLLSRLLMAAALVATAFLLMPMEALAHAGHRHANDATEPPAPSLQRPAPPQVAEVALIVQAAMPHASSAFVSLLPTGGPKSTQSCPSGCCHSAGTGCCALWLPPSVEIFVPPLGRLAPIVSVVGEAGVTPGALPEPPNSLV
jgi:hypothetical protein